MIDNKRSISCTCVEKAGASALTELLRLTCRGWEPGRGLAGAVAHRAFCGTEDVLLCVHNLAGLLADSLHDFGVTVTCADHTNACAASGSVLQGLSLHAGSCRGSQD